MFSYGNAPRRCLPVGPGETAIARVSRLVCLACCAPGPTYIVTLHFAPLDISAADNVANGSLSGLEEQARSIRCIFPSGRGGRWNKITRGFVSGIEKTPEIPSIRRTRELKLRSRVQAYNCDIFNEIAISTLFPAPNKEIVLSRHILALINALRVFGTRSALATRH